MGMGNVDQAEQLCLQQCVHYWLRNKKWWFAIYFWYYELSLTNFYVLYRMFFELHDKSPPYIHYKLIRDIFLAWIDPENYCPEPTSNRSPLVQDSTSTK